LTKAVLTNTGEPRERIKGARGQRPSPFTQTKTRDRLQDTHSPTSILTAGARGVDTGLGTIGKRTLEKRKNKKRFLRRA